MMSPSSFAVLALKFLQKSMMLTPCGPSAVPTGGAGVALPAAIWSFTTACIFFAMCGGYLFLLCGGAPPPPSVAARLTLAAVIPTTIRSVNDSVSVSVSDLLNLKKIKFHGRGAAEDRHHHLQRVLVEVHLVDHAVEAGERPFVDPHLLALLGHVLRLRLLGRRPHLLEDLFDLLLAERRRLRAGADEAGYLRRVLHHVPRVVGHVHLDQDVAGKEPLRGDDLLAAAHLHNVLGRDEDFADVVLQPVRLDALLQRFGD